MAYIVNKRDNTVVATVADGTIDTTSTSITILGKGFNNYGEIVAENFVHMTEHFASGDPAGPDNAIRGQLWFDINEAKLKVNLSNIAGSPNWATLGASFIQGSEPTTDFEAGTFWYDTSTDTLNISTDGVTFTPVTSSSVTTVASVSPVEGDMYYDTTTKQLKIYNAALHSGGAGFDVIGPARHVGPTAPTTDVLDGDMWFDSTNKQLYVYDEVNAEFRLVGPNTAGGAFAVSPGITNVIGATNNGNPIIQIIIDDEIVGIWSAEDFIPSPAITGFAELKRGLTLSTVAGPSSEPTVFGGDATGAFYADLAERYAVDGPVGPGDLVSMGGEAEITKTTVEADMNIFGVVSTSPGLKLNVDAGTDQTHPFIAMTGRIPCKVVGLVKKGERLVSSSIPGVAKAIANDEVMANYVAVFGRALETNATPGEKLIEVVVGVK